MQAEDVGNEFGAVSSRHRVDNKRRLVSGFWALAIGVVAMALGVFLTSVTDYSDGVAANRNVGATIGLGLIGLFFAAFQLSKALRGGSDEYFEVRDEGIVYANARQVRGWSWDNLIEIKAAYRATENRLSNALGTGFRCKLTFGDGAQVRIDGLTENPTALLQTIRQHRPDLPVTPGGNRLAAKLGPWWLALAAAFTGATIWMLATILNSSTVQDVTDANGNVTETQIDTVSNTGYLLLGTGILLCLIGLLVSLTMFLTYRRKR